jgi:flagellar basal body-associated protein FliL
MAARSAEAEPASADASVAKPKKPVVMIAMAVVTVIVLMIAGKSVLGGGGKHSAKEKAPVVEEIGATVALDEFLVNLSGGGDHYLKAAISIGLRKGVTEDAIKEKTAPIRDAVVSVLSSQTLASLGTEKARESLKEELKTKINDATGDKSVLKIYFTSFATQ